MLRPRISLHPKKILSVDRKGVLNLQFSIVFHRISSFNPLPDCKFGTPKNVGWVEERNLAFIKTDCTLNKLGFVPQPSLHSMQQC